MALLHHSLSSLSERPQGLWPRPFKRAGLLFFRDRFYTRGSTVHYKIKIKTAAGVQHLDGIFASKWAAIDAGMDVLGEAEGNVVATQVTP